MRNLGPARLAMMGAVGLGLIGFFFYLTSRIAAPNMELLYSELSTADAAAIGEQLTQANIPFQVDPTGTKIMVPAGQVGQVRMQMAQQGLPSGGNVGYELFDRTEGFGTTSFIQNMNQLRALEGEMARTVGTLAGVQQARVHLVLPRRELFSRQRNTATASVFLKLRPGARLEREQIAAIQHIIASAVPDLEPSRVAIVDSSGRLLARGMDQDSPAMMMQTAEEKKRAYERRLTRTIEELLGRSLGYGAVRAEVSADLDFDRITTNEEFYDPDAQVVRSTQTVTEGNRAEERDPLEPVTVDANLPGGNQAAGAEGSVGPLTSSQSNRTEETINYEISRTVRSHVRETGVVRRLSIAVLIDGTYQPGAEGEAPVYQPRSQDELDQIEKLVASAVGYDAVRGDVLEVVNMRFTSAEEEFEAEGDKIFGIPKDDLFRIAEMLILGIVAVLIILLVVRPLITKAFERPGDEEDEMGLLTDQSGAPIQIGGLADDLALEAAQADEDLEQMIDINRVEGRVRASSLRKVGEIIDKHPEEAVAIIRNWLYQEG